MAKSKEISPQPSRDLSQFAGERFGKSDPNRGEESDPIRPRDDDRVLGEAWEEMTDRLAESYLLESRVPLLEKLVDAYRSATETAGFRPVELIDQQGKVIVKLTPLSPLKKSRRSPPKSR